VPLVVVLSTSFRSSRVHAHAHTHTHTHTHTHRARTRARAKPCETLFSRWSYSAATLRECREFRVVPLFTDLTEPSPVTKDVPRNGVSAGFPFGFRRSQAARARGGRDGKVDGAQRGSLDPSQIPRLLISFLKRRSPTPFSVSAFLAAGMF